MKHPIEWHKECFENRAKSLKRMIADLSELERQVYDAKIQLAIYSEQIQRAEREGLEGFDGDKFNIPCKVKEGRSE